MSLQVGMGSTFQGYGDALSDEDVYGAEVHLADLAEPLGFDSIWGLEHHFTSYAMCPDIIQFLTFMAGRTERVKLGSMVAVLPWHKPVRLAEQLLMLDNLSGGRVIFGIGRGTGKVEFDGLSVDMATARKSFVEAAQAILSALETGVMEHDGEIVQQPRVELRPRPIRTFRDRTYSASVSPESAEIMANLGTGLLVVPQKPWPLVQEDAENYRRAYRAAIGQEPPGPFCQCLVFVDESEDRAEALAREYISGYWQSVVAHYEFDKPHLQSTPGYEFHGQMYDRLAAPGGMKKMSEFYLSLQPWGTPSQVFEKITHFTELVGAAGVIPVFRFGGMRLDEAERNMRLFAKDLLPELKSTSRAVGARAQI